MEDTGHHQRKAQGFGRVKDRQGIGEGLRVLGQIAFLCRGSEWLLDPSQATVRTRKQEVVLPCAQHCTHIAMHLHLAVLLVRTALHSPPSPASEILPETQPLRQFPLIEILS